MCLKMLDFFPECAKIYMLQNIIYLILNLRINTPLKFSLRQIKYRRENNDKGKKTRNY